MKLVPKVAMMGLMRPQTITSPLISPKSAPNPRATAIVRRIGHPQLTVKATSSALALALIARLRSNSPPPMITIDWPTARIPSVAMLKQMARNTPWLKNVRSSRDTAMLSTSHAAMIDRAVTYSGPSRRTHARSEPPGVGTAIVWSGRMGRARGRGRRDD